MAIIYGISEATKDFLKKLPKEVKTLEDIPKIHQKLTEEYDAIENKGLFSKFSSWNKKRQIKKIEENSQDAGFHLKCRFPVYPEFFSFLNSELKEKISALEDSQGYVKKDYWK